MSRRKLSRTAEERRALFRGSVTSLFLHDKIITTEAKAKEIRPVAEKLITWAKTDDLHNRRLAASYVTDPAALQRLFGEIGPANIDRPGGYTRIIKLGQRRGDSTPMAIIELVDMPGSSVTAGSAKAKK